VGGSARVQQDAAEECDARRDQPLRAPRLNGLPINQSTGGVDESGGNCRSEAYEADDEADHRAQA